MDWIKPNMKQIDAILQDSRFQYGLQRVTELEKERIFCCHRLDHLLDVARIAWIMVLEQNLSLKKEIVYGAALLHDLGRYRQYEENIPHHKASAELAVQILPDAGYTEEETAMIAEAISQHGDALERQSILARVLYQADKLSRCCFQCAAQAECKWNEEKRNKTILY
jgi:HD superfamily phosphodiesterase